MTPPTQSILRVAGLAKTYQIRDRGHLHAIADISFSMGSRELMCVIGPTGCGKTTLLRILAGLEEPSEGTLSWFPPQHSLATRVAMVFQDYSRSLFPWYNTRQQLELACHPYSYAKKASIDDTLAMTGLSPYEDFLPKELSGGMQQRVALARSLVTRPQLLLMDEPFGSVDAQTRYKLEDHLLGIWSQREVAILLVTHDIDEALYLADRVLILSDRPARSERIVDIDLPRPRSHAVTRSAARFGELRRELWAGLNSVEVGR